MYAENAIEVNGLEKSFRIYYDKGQSLKERLLFRNRSYYEKRQVIKGISFEVKKGEAIGFIGENGCGKSTLLKLLTKIIYPDAGSIQTCGRISSLIELGAGFHPDMSGKENIYTNASIFGLSRKEIDDRLQTIIDFSELHDFMDNPVRTYSSGMYMRLAFAVAINVDADILLIDEILGVGDAAFQAKCFERLKQIKKDGTTIIIVSHSLGQIEQICERSLWIHDGLIKEAGVPREIHPMYLDYIGQKRGQAAKEISKQNKQEENIQSENIEESEIKDGNVARKNIKRWGNGKARIIQIDLLDVNGDKKTVFEIGTDITVRLAYKVYTKVEDAVIGVGIFRSDGTYCYGSNTRLDQIEKFDLLADGEIEIQLKHIMLMPGQYTLDLAIESELGIPVDYYTRAVTLEIYSVKSDVGLVRVEHEWNFK